MTDRLAPRLLARNTGLNLLGLGLPMAVAVACMPVLARGLSLSEFGLLGIAWLVLGYANELGFGRATTRFVAEALETEADAVGGVAWITLGVQAAFGLTAGVVLAVLAPVLARDVLRVPAALAADAETSFRLLAAAVPLIVCAAALRGVLEALQRFDLVNAVRGPVTASNFLLPLVVLLAGGSITTMVVLLVAARAAALVFYAGMALHVVPALRRRPALPRGWLARVLSFGGWTSVSGVVSPMLIYLDRFLLGALLSLAAVAYYTAPYEVVARLLIVPASIAATLFPAFSGLHGRGSVAEAARLGVRGTRYTLLMVGPAAVLLIGAAPDLLGAWLGAPFARESTLALQLLAVGMAVNAAAHVPAALLQGLGRADLPARFHLIELPVHAVAASGLILLLGVTGAALAWCLRAGLDAGLLFRAAARETGSARGSARGERLAGTVAVLVVFAAAAGATALLLPGAALRLAAAFVVTGVAVFVLWRYAVADGERAQLYRLAGVAGAR